MVAQRFPEGTKYKEVYAAFDALAQREVPGAMDTVLMLEEVSPHDPETPMEDRLLGVFRQRYEVLLRAEQTM